MADRDNTPSLEILKQLRDVLKDGLLAHNTRRGYRYDWSLFREWSTRMNTTALPATADTLALYVGAELSRGQKVSTLTRRLAAIAHAHRSQGFTSPVTSYIRELLRGARRLRLQEVRQVRPLTVADLHKIACLLAVDARPIALRDRAIVLVGFTSALRGASLVNLQLRDVQFHEQGLTLMIRREKQDQEGHGRQIGIPHARHTETCPVRSLRDWIAWRGARQGPLFTRFDFRDATLPLQPEQICRIVKDCASRIGLDPAMYGSHSMRAGFITACGEQGIGDLLIAAQTGHRDMAVLRTYFRHTDLFRANACGMIGL
jgi:integrase